MGLPAHPVLIVNGKRTWLAVPEGGSNLKLQLELRLQPLRRRLHIGFHLYFCAVVCVDMQLHMQTTSRQCPQECYWCNPQYQSKSRRRSSLLCRLSGKYQQCWRQIDSDFSCSLSCSYIFVFTVVMSLYAEMHTRKCDAVTDNFI